MPSTGKSGEIALAGYAADHQYVLSVHKGCDARIDAPEPGVITHMCDSAPGESGAPILLLRDGDYGCGKWRMAHAATGFRAGAQHRGHDP